MFIVYDLIFLVIVLITLPVYLFRRKFHREFYKRFGVLPKNLKLERPIWIHAVSVGEVKLVHGLIDELRNIFPDKKFVISTVTPTGQMIARDFIKEGDFLTYLPLDFSFIVNSVVKKINPSLFIIAETEIWPNLIRKLYKRHIPIVTVNGRISDVSFSGYSSIDFLIRPILRKISLFCVQTELDKNRLISLGVAENKIKVTGNMKFDFAIPHDPEKDRRVTLGLSKEDKLLVCGSTHPGEEQVILSSYKKLSGEYGCLKLLIAPRHPERAREIGELVKVAGFSPVFLSEARGALTGAGKDSVFILDTMGELANYYSAADIVFVGKSLVNKGGQNILEPALFKKPIISGPYTFNFRDTVKLFVDNRAIRVVWDMVSLSNELKDLLDNPDNAATLGRRAFDLLAKGRGATLRNASIIRELYA